MADGNRFNSVFIAAFAIVVLATIYVTKEFISTILLSAFLTYLMNPLYQRLLKVTNRKALSSFITILIVTLAFLFAILSVVDMLTTELSHLIAIHNNSYWVSSTSQNVPGFIERLIPNIADRFVPVYLKSYISEHTTEILDRLTELPRQIATWSIPIIQNGLSSLASELPIKFAQFLVVIFITYYLLIDGTSFVEKAISLLPEEKIAYSFVHELDAIYNTLFNVYFITCMMSGVLAAIGLLILGVPYPLVWGTIIGVLTLIPLLGPTTVVFPMAIYYLLMHDYLRAVLLVVFCVVVLMVLPENVIRPRMAMKGAAIHPVVTILAFTAPIFVVGIMGVVIGPALYGFILAGIRTIRAQKLNKIKVDDEKEDVESVEEPDEKDHD